MRSVGERGKGGPVPGDGGGVGPVRVFISYAHDDLEHEERVREFWTFLRVHGVDARLDKPAAERRQDWPLWMLHEVRQARFVLVVASSAYRERAEGDVPPGVGLGVQWEAALIREEVYADREAALNRFIPVVLRGCAARNIPTWLGRETSTHYVIPEYTVPGADRLLRLLLGHPYETEPPLGRPPVLPPRFPTASAGRPGLRTEVLIHASGDGAGLVADVAVAGTPLCRRDSTLPHELRTVWEGLRGGPLVAAGRMLTAGRQLAVAVFDDRSHQLVAEVLHRLPPGDWVDVVWVADGAALDLPVELLRLTTAAGEDLGPLALRAGVTVIRRVAGVPRIEPVAAPGPVKILAAVAAPDESRTGNAPLDTEAEMQAVLDAVADIAGDPRAQVRILEVGSVQQIVTALRADAYHVLHLSAHGSTDEIDHWLVGPANAEATHGAAELGVGEILSHHVPGPRPDAQSVPAKLREIITYRYCTQVVDRTSSDMALGKGQSTQGADASILSEDHKGVGVLGHRPGILRDHPLRLYGPTHLRHGLRARRALRILYQS